MAARPTVAGVAISHPGRVLFPTAGATKLDLANYYAAVSEWMVPHVAGRPLTLVRCPTGVRAASAGVHKAPECVYMRHGKVWGPAALRRVRIREKTKVGEYLVADSVAGLVSLAQMDVLEIHTWNSTVDDIEHPDRLVLDIDPGHRIAWPAVVGAARLIRGLLDALSLASFVKSTGGRGLHVVVPLAPGADWSACLDFARALGETLVRRDPQFTTRFAKAGREDKLLIDYLRNNRTNTSIAAFSTRAKPDAPVSVPLAWNELRASERPDRFTIRTVPARLARLRRDPWEGYSRVRQTIPSGATDALERL